MKKNIILIIISLFVFSSLNAQNKKGIIYEYKKTQFTSSLGTKGFFQVGYIKRLTKNIGFGGSISHHRADRFEWVSGYVYNDQYDLSLGEYDIDGNFVGFAGYDSFGNYDPDNGAYQDGTGLLIGTDGGYARDTEFIEQPAKFSSIAFMVDFKWNLMVKKRIQPVFMYSIGYATGLGVIARASFGLDLHSKNDMYVLTLFQSGLDSDLSTVGIKFTIKK